MRVQHGRVEWRDEKIEVCEHNGHGAVDDAVGAVDEALGLIGESGGVRCEGQWRISDSIVSLGSNAGEIGNGRQVKLAAPSDPRGGARSGRCHVTVVGANRCERCQPIDF